jgi:hypothetical protein
MPMNSRKPWQPKMDDTERTLNPSASPVSDREGILDTPQIRDPAEDSAPLQGSKDLSDDDSLEDVIADDADDEDSPALTPR